MNRRTALLMALAATAFSAVDSAGQEPPSLADVAFLSGCWEGGAGNLEMREQWSEAVGGVMLGTTRFFRAGALVDWEFARLEQTDSAAVLWPYPRGERSEHGFPLVRAGEEAVFENLAHDFPVRIVYRRMGPDRVAPRIEGRDGDGAGWELRRVTCPS